MRLLVALLLLSFAAPSPEIRYFRYERPVQNTPQSSGQACFLIDPGVFAKAAPGLADLRLYRDTTETPYVLQTSATTAPSEQNIAPLNLGRRAGQTVFDAAMPPETYSDLKLAVSGHDFIATVTVTGSQTQTAAAETRIGAYTIFDLSLQRLGRSTVLHLPVSDFRFLHFRIAGPIQPENVTGISVVRLPRSQPRYLAVAASSHIAQKGRETVIEFTVPAHTPVDRVVFDPASQNTNFSRDVAVSATPILPSPATNADEPPQSQVSFGTLLRVHSTQDGHRIDEERMSVDAPAADFNDPAKWVVTVENGDDRPIDFSSVRLEMLERKLCFEAAGAASYTLYYGDPALAAPRYDYAALITPQADAAQASIGPETPNPSYTARPDERPFTEKHPALLWAALVFVIVLLAGVALRQTRPRQITPS
jgi:hypothetical protein